MNLEPLLSDYEQLLYLLSSAKKSLLEQEHLIFKATCSSLNVNDSNKSKNYFQLEATLSQLKGILNKTWIIVQSQATLSNTAHSQPENIRLSIWCVKT